MSVLLGKYNVKTAWILHSALLVFLCAGFLSCNGEKVVIDSFILRDRVIVLDKLVLKKALYVAFSSASSADCALPCSCTVQGELYRDGTLLAESSRGDLQGKNGNVVFDLPAALPEGSYVIRIALLNKPGSLIGRGTKNATRAELKSVWAPNDKPSDELLREIPVQQRKNEVVTASEQDKHAGYVLFARSTLSYAFPEEMPRQHELIDRISLHTARSKYLPVTFSIYPLQTLGLVRVAVSNLKGSQGTIARENISLGYVDTVDESIGSPRGTYRRMPEIIRRADPVQVSKDRSCRFWLTINIDKNIAAGTYQGEIVISPQYGKKRVLPIGVTVAPITLEEVPGKEYFMLMTYEFTELTMPWSTPELKKIEQAGRAIFRDYRKHGMTTVCIHSPFIFTRKDDGSPRLDDVYAALLAARDEGFHRVIWYMGHLIQTSKPRHPGNIRGYEDAVQKARLKELVQKVHDFVKEHHCPETVILPIDEPDDTTQDSDNKRKTVTPQLLAGISKTGGKTMLTAGSTDTPDLIDYFSSNAFHQQDRDAFHQADKPYWMYNNDVTTRCDNPAYARYIYGYYLWKHAVDGMSSWTFQNTQNAVGLPGKTDAPAVGLYLAYPDPVEPLATLKWEAIREGIDDYRYIHQLEKRVAQLKKGGLDTAEYDAFLADIRTRLHEPNCAVEITKESENSFFDVDRAALISLIVDADRRLQKRVAVAH